VVLVFIAVILIAGLALIVPFYSTGDQAEPGLGFWIGLSLSIFVAVCLAFAWALFTQLMIPIMYRQRCRARLRLLKPWTGKLATRADPALRFVPSAVSSRGGYG